MQRDSTELKIKEVIVVEGRDDTHRIKEALNADTYETGGFGYSTGVLEDLDNLYKARGLIIFTDPDYGGKKIRRDLKKRYPHAKEAHISLKEALKDNDLGIENASLETIQAAIKRARPTYIKPVEKYTNIDMIKYGLNGRPESKDLREALAISLKIPGGNARAFLRSLNSNQVPRKTLEEELDKLREI